MGYGPHPTYNKVTTDYRHLQTLSQITLSVGTPNTYNTMATAEHTEHNIEVDPSMVCTYV
jgi:hypothetical protein